MAAEQYKLSYTAEDINAKLGKIDTLAEKSDIPEKISDFENDSGFITEAYVRNYAQPVGDYALKSDIKNVDLSDYALKTEIPTDYLRQVPSEYVTEQELQNKGYLTEYIETDPTVPAWAKAKQKPTYTAAEVGALPADTVIPVIPTYISEFMNDAGYITEHQDLSDYTKKDYVNDAIANLVNSAPDALNTLDELAAALGDDENFATTVTNQIAGKLDATALPSAINDALAQAKASGEFNGIQGEQGIQGETGAAGYTPVRGTDYWTEADKAEMIETVRSSIPTFNLTEMGLPLVPIDGTSIVANMDCTAIRNALETGPIKSVFNISFNGHSTPFTSVACGLYLSSDDCWQVSSVATVQYGNNPVTMVSTFNVRTDNIRVDMYTIAYRSDIQSYIDSSILGGAW